MGVDLYLNDAKGLVRVEPFDEGGLRPAAMVGGVLTAIPSVEARVSITYNYSPVLAEVLPGFTGLVELFHGRSAGDVAPDLRLIVEVCGTERYRDYWAPTRGNVGAIMQTILGWCEQHPDAVFDAEG